MFSERTRVVFRSLSGERSEFTGSGGRFDGLLRFDVDAGKTEAGRRQVAARAVISKLDVQVEISRV